MLFSVIKSFAATRRETKRAGGCMAVDEAGGCPTYSTLQSSAKTTLELINKWVFSYQELLSVSTSKSRHNQTVDTLE